MTLQNYDINRVTYPPKPRSFKELNGLEQQKIRRKKQQKEKLEK